VDLFFSQSAVNQEWIY